MTGAERSGERDAEDGGDGADQDGPRQRLRDGRTQCESRTGTCVPTTNITSAKPMLASSVNVGSVWSTMPKPVLPMTMPATSSPMMTGIRVRQRGQQRSGQPDRDEERQRVEAEAGHAGVRPARTPAGTGSRCSRRSYSWRTPGGSRRRSAAASPVASPRTSRIGDSFLPAPILARSACTCGLLSAAARVARPAGCLWPCGTPARHGAERRTTVLSTTFGVCRTRTQEVARRHRSRGLPVHRAISPPWLRDVTQPAIQLPWNPNGTRCGSLILATGSPEKSDASMITRSLPSRAGS